MRKQLGMLTSFLFLSAVALVGFGCSDNRCCDTDNTAPVYEHTAAPVYEQPCRPVCPEPCRPVCPPVCKPVCPEPCAPACKPVCQPPACKPVCPPPACKPVCAAAPVCPPEPCCKIPVKCRHPASAELRCYDFITVTARNPNMCLLGDQYPLDFDVKACDDVCDVVVTTHLPEGVSLIKSQPEAQVEGRKLTWHFGSMAKGECRLGKVLVKCECEGEQCACFCATATPVRFCSLLCAKPILTCEKCGPEEVCPGDPINYRITVTNHGSCAATDVVVVDNLPVEVEHASGQRTLTFKLGCIEPCQSKTINICATAVKRSKSACNTAVVSACNADSTSCQWCTCICCCGVDIVKVGPKEVAIGKNADYQITVTNTGDKTLTDVVVTDNAPSSTSIVAANGATINGNQAVWRMRELQVGEKANFNITLTTCTPGCFTDRAGVTTCQGCTGCSEFTTRWKGRPALNVCPAVADNPLCIGERTTYTVDVVNQGSEADDNVVVVVKFPSTMKPVAATGDAPGTVSGQTVTFAPFNNLRARQGLKYRIDAEAVSSGDARVDVEVTSRSATTAITAQESAIVN